jgi:CHAT domain-containing protein
MVSLPLHAAGTYHQQPHEYVGDYAVSSYTPTLTALHRILTEMPNGVTQSRDHAKILLLAQPETIENPSIPNALIEVEFIRDLVPAGSLLDELGLSNNSVDSVLARVPDANILHLACHGHQDRQNPLNSGFDLENGRLTLGDLMQFSTPNAQLAYLSACESAGMDESRPDEGLNLAGAMIFVGFKSVVATLW